MSLPRKWCDRNKLEEGEEIDVIEKGEHLLLSKGVSKGIGKVSVDISGLDRSTIIMLVLSLYQYGYDTIVINTKDSKAKYHLANKEVSIASTVSEAISRLIGAEIISSSKNSYTIEVVTEDAREKFDTVLRRIFRLLIEMFDAFIEGIRNKDKEQLESVAFFQQINIRKFANYALRLLNKFGHKEAENTTFYFAIVKYLNKTSEMIKNFAGFLVVEGSMNNLSDKFCDLMEEINKSVKLYYDSFYKYDIKQISQLHMNRDLFKRKLYRDYKKLSKDDLFVLGNMMQIFAILLDLSEMRMAIGH
jgi:phosphate uptake regulator